MEEILRLTDKQLLSLISDGSESAFSVLFYRYNRQLYAHAYNKLRDAEEAKDVVQEVFINLWNIARQQHLLTERLSGYLQTAVRNKVFDILSKKKSASAYLTSLQDFIDQADVQTDHPIRERQMQDIIDAAISTLPNRMRTVFELSRKEHLSHREIGQQLNISDQTVTDQIKKALRILRVKLGIILGLLLIFIR